MSKIEKAVSFMETIAANDSYGYDQSKRNGGVDYDCSSLLATALHNAGYHVSKSSTTKNLKKQLLACGFNDITSDERKRGDIFLKEGHHVVMCVNSSHVVYASLNENGKTTGGEPGDQTGKEILVAPFYQYSGGWDYHFRATEDSEGVSENKSAITYSVGSVYTLKTELNVRTGPGTDYASKSHNQLSTDGKKHDADKDGALSKGTKVTCNEIRYAGADIWMRVPSGWLAAYYQGKVFIE